MFHTPLRMTSLKLKPGLKDEIKSFEIKSFAGNRKLDEKKVSRIKMLKLHFSLTRSILSESTVIPRYAIPRAVS